MKKEEVLKKLRLSVIKGDSIASEAAAREAIEAELDPLEAIEEALSPGIREVGDKFERLELFLPEMIMAAEAMSRGVAVLEECLPNIAARMSAGVVVIGTVAGDIHDIGKNIVTALLRVNGFKVYDLGKDVTSNHFIEKAQEVKADVIGLSALLSSTMVNQQDVISMLKDLNLRDQYKVIVGGAPVTAEWAREIGADAYARNAAEGVEKIKELVKTSAGSG